jgi:hypothetical protein
MWFKVVIKAVVVVMVMVEVMVRLMLGVMLIIILVELAVHYLKVVKGSERHVGVPFKQETLSTLSSHRIFQVIAHFRIGR